MSDTDSILVVPRWGGAPQDDWYPWIREQLGPRIEVLDMPQPDVPSVEVWPGAVLDALARHDSPVTLVGHSVGCQAILRALGQLPDGSRVRDVLCVAGWWAVDDPWETIQPWMEPVSDLERVRKAAGPVHVLLSTNDPFTADHAENGRLWTSRLGARVTVVPDAKHFNAAQEPIVLDLLGRQNES